MAYKNGILVDFDGTLFEDEFPNIGKPIKKVIKFCKRHQQEGTPIILWTCRQGQELENAVEACAAHGLEFDAVNHNPFSEFAHLGAGPKPYADLYIDDKSMHPDDIPNLPSEEGRK